MAQRHSRNAPIYEYQPLHITAAGTVVPVGACVATTATTAIAVGIAVVTPASMANITNGMFLNIAGGTGTAETVQITAITATTFTATFVNTHSGTYNITSLRGSYIGTFVVNKVGTTDIITLYNGSPNSNPAGSSFAVVPAAVGTYTYNGVIDKGLYYTVTGTAGDYTLMYLDAQ